jgi:putative effector of murein hydrolase
MFKVRHPVAKGVAIGISSHAGGTTKAMEMGEVEGAMSALSIVIAGVITLILSAIIKNFIGLI